MKFDYVTNFLESIGCFISEDYKDDYPRNIRSEKFVRRELMPVFYFIISLIVFGVVLIVVFLSVVSDLKNIILGTSMFQRSGALLVGSALFLEYRYRKCECNFRTKIPNDHLWANDNPRLEFIYKYTPITVVFSAIVGTGIWAYGDFIFKADAMPC